MFPSCCLRLQARPPAFFVALQFIIFNCCRAGSQNLALTTLVLSGTGLVHAEVPELVQQLRKFPSLQQLDVSNNPGLRLLTDGMLRIVATLQSFHCDGCSLQLPMQSLFKKPEENPWCIQQLLLGRVSETALNISGARLTPADASEVAGVLKHFPALKQLDLSDNPELGCSGVASFLSSLAGKRPLAFLFCS